jgi:hypothetical protein
MVADTSSPHGHGRVLLAADAFLFAAALDITITSLLVGAMYLFAGKPTPLDTMGGPVLGAILSLGVTALPLIGGAALAWIMHGRRLTWPSAGGMVLGFVAGIFISMAVLVGGANLISQIPIGPREGPPWLLIGVVALIALAIVVAPAVDAARDAGHGRRRHVALDWVRLVALVLTVALAVIVLPGIGATMSSDLGEAGIFMVPFAVAAAFAVLGGDAVETWLQHRKEQPGHTAMSA